MGNYKKMDQILTMINLYHTIIVTNMKYFS